MQKKRQTEERTIRLAILNLIFDNGETSRLGIPLIPENATVSTFESLKELLITSINKQGVAQLNYFAYNLVSPEGQQEVYDLEKVSLGIDMRKVSMYSINEEIHVDTFIIKQ